MGHERLVESESPPPQASVQIEGRDSGPPIITVTVHAVDVAEAARLAREQYDALVERYATPNNGQHAPTEAVISAPMEAVISAPTETATSARTEAVISAPRVADAEVLTPEHEPPTRAPGVQSWAKGVQSWMPRVILADFVTRLASWVDRHVLFLGIGGALLSLVAWMVIYSHGSQPLVWDANQYYGLALQLNQTGPGGWVNPLRTYVYPFFVAAFVATIGDNAVRVQHAVGLAEWLVNLGVAGAAGWAIFRVTGSRGRGLIAFGLIALNPILLVQTTSLLSDSLSASMIALAVIPIVAGWQRELRGASVGWLMVASLCCASLAAEVRPANAIIIPVIIVLWIVRAVWHRSYPWRWLPLVVVGLILPLLPQMLANQRGFGVPHPLTVSSNLYQESLQAGMVRLKSRTSVVPHMPAELVHWNPLYPPTARMPSEFFEQSPAGYLATLFIHGFALVDLDLPYTYVFDYHPWYRWPLAILSYLFWLLAVVGAGSALMQALRLRAIEPTTWAVLAPAVVGLTYLAVHLPVAPDIRYGTPLFLLAVPAVGAGLVEVRCSAGQSRGRAAGWIAATLIVVAACASLSAWISQQAPPLRG